MLNFNKRLTALAFLTLIATSGALPAVATRAQTPAQRLCRVDRLPPGTKPGCTVIVNARGGVAIRSGPGFNYKKIGVIPYSHDVNVNVTKSSRNWVELDGARGWIHVKNLYMAGD